MELALKIFQFILSISILVTLHEIGHFLPAKWFKTKVDKFFLFFDPYFSIFAMKKINGKWQYKFFSKNQPTDEEVEINGKKVTQGYGYYTNGGALDKWVEFKIENDTVNQKFSRMKY